MLIKIQKKGLHLSKLYEEYASKAHGGYIGNNKTGLY